MSQLFRPQVLAQVADPDQLDQSLRLIRPGYLLGFGLIGLIMIAGLVWSLVSTAPVKAGGSGVLLSPAGVAAVTVTGAGYVDTLRVAPGDRVQAGQVLALIRQPVREDALRAAEEEAEDARQRLASMSAEFARQETLQTDLTQRLRAATEARITSLDAQLDTLNQRLAGEAGLRDQGMVSAVSLFETQTQVAQVGQELAAARNRLTELELEHEREAARRQQQLAELAMQAQNLARKAANLRREFERDRQVMAPAAGIVAEISVDLHEPVSAGQRLARLLVTAAAKLELTALAYVPARDGKKIQPGMEAYVSPSTVRFELDGYLLGRVTRVAELPATREGLMRRLKNAVLVDDILRAGTPLEIEVALTENPDTPSGYAWTSGLGPEVHLEPGTLARTEVVVDRIHLISLLFPAMDYVFGWVKAR